MYLLAISVIAVACCWFYFKLLKINNYFKDLGVPYVPPLPLFGNVIALLVGRKHISKIITDAYEYNPNAKYIGFFQATKPVVLLRDPELIKDITIKHYNSFINHQRFVDSTVDPFFGNTLFSSRGEKWREARALLIPNFTSSKIKFMYDNIISCVENLIEHIEKIAKDPSNVVDTNVLFTKYTSDVITVSTLGIIVNSYKDPNNEFYVLGKKTTGVDLIMSIKIFLAGAFPWLHKFFRLKIVPDDVGRFFMDIVQRTITMREEQGIARPDILQLLMDARSKESKHLKLDLREITAQIFIFLFGGLDTSATQTNIIALELIINPDIQAKLQAEIDEVAARTNGRPSYEDIQGMMYLDAVYNESMRRHTQCNILDRVCNKEYQLPPALPDAKPFTIPVGMSVWIPALGINHDEKYYENPHKFYPERYLNKKVTTSQVENLGFGIGPRSCIGNRFAIMETKILFFYLLSKFTLKPNPKTCMNFAYSVKTVSIFPEKGFWATFEPRVRPQL